MSSRKCACSSLKLEGVYELLKGDTLPESFSTLTQLTYLDLEGVTTSSLAPIMALPGLEHVRLRIYDNERQPSSLPLQSTRLTQLHIWSTRMESVSSQHHNHNYEWPGKWPLTHLQTDG